MPMLLTGDALRNLAPAEGLLRLPVPSRIISNGEFTPPRQSMHLKRYEHQLIKLGTQAAAKRGITLNQYWQSPTAMASAFAMLNEQFGAAFSVADDEATDDDAAVVQREAIRHQFVFDDQVHFLKDDADAEFFVPLTGLIELSADILRLPYAGKFTIDHIKFAHFLKCMYLDSDTKVALLSGAPSENEAGLMLSNDQMAAARDAVNIVAGGRRLLTHAVISPGHDGWLDEVDRVHAEIKPEGWKGYTVGEPFSPSDRRWRLDDEALMYPAYERMVKAGMKNFCIHKGLLPENADEVMPGAEPFARVDDLGKAARDWPQLNFIIYHAAYRTLPQPTEAEVARFEREGRLDWVSDLAEIPARYGVTNVYADTAASFAFTVLTHPRLAAAMLGILVKGLGADHVLWGTDSVWYGSPQWQIEAFRRLQMPKDLQQRFGFADFGDADSDLRRGILGLNGARLYGLNPADYAAQTVQAENLDAIVSRYHAAGGGPSNQTYGYADNA
jgi:uncharacterized protein